MQPPSASQPNMSDRLWNKQVTLQNYGSNADLYRTHVFEQYKLYVQSADQISVRRGLTNTFFLAIQSALLTAIGLAYEPGWHFQPRWLVIFPLAAAIILCATWWLTVKSYRQLNTVKFQVIEEFEKRLPTAPFVEAEWKGALGEGKNPSLYVQLTDVEKIVPIICGVLYIFGTLAVTLF